MPDTVIATTPEMTTPTDETPPLTLPPTPPESFWVDWVRGLVGDEIGLDRLSGEKIAQLRRVCFSRWLVRIKPFGEHVLPLEREVFGRRAPAVFVDGPEIGVELARFWYSGDPSR